MRFLEGEDIGFGEDGVLYVFHDFPLFESIIVCDFVGLNFEDLYSESELFHWGCHLLVRVVFFIIGPHSYNFS